MRKHASPAHSKSGGPTPADQASAHSSERSRATRTANRTRAGAAQRATLRRRARRHANQTRTCRHHNQGAIDAIERDVRGARHSRPTRLGTRRRRDAPAAFPKPNSAAAPSAKTTREGVTHSGDEAATKMRDRCSNAATLSTSSSSGDPTRTSDGATAAPLSGRGSRLSGPGPFRVEAE